MNVIAAIFADLESTPLGTTSRLADEIHGESVLLRTVKRVKLVEGLSEICVLCPEAQVGTCRSLVSGTNARVIGCNSDPSPWAPIVRSARKWSIQGWRGGVAGTTCFDEFADCRLLAGLLEAVKAQCVLCVAGASPLFDAELAQQMIELRAANVEDVRMVFAQAPPGLCGLLMDASLIRELADQAVPIGWVFNYQPDRPRKDLIFEPCCLEVPQTVRYAVGRLVADTRRSVELIAHIIATGNDGDASTICNVLTARRASTVEPLPVELEIELTTDDPYPDALLVARGDRVGRRGPLSEDVIAGVVSELCAFDDSLIVLGGFGDPLRHPGFSDVLCVIATASPMGLAVRTSGVDLNDENIEAMIDCNVDVLQVTINAWSQELYGRLHSPNDSASADLEALKVKLSRVDELRVARQVAHPMVVPTMIKARDNVEELDDFYDGWIRAIGTASISGYSDCAGQLGDRFVMNMAPPGRTACKRLRSSCLVLADGSVTMCDQDFAARHAAGSLNDQSLSQIWTGAKLTALREAHQAGQFDINNLCAACTEWHRP